MVNRNEAQELLRTAMGNGRAEFREGQWEAVDSIVNGRRRVLCVQRTGWGKSMVYFLAAKLLRNQGRGVTIIVSPLLALMRNQIEAADLLGLKALTVNSTNRDAWDDVRAQLLAGEVDLLLISPERLANDEFVVSTLQPIAGRVSLLVVDEAHCISDWGHDFRPDYRRIGQVLARLPENIAVLATTATANRRVQEDVAAQLRGDVVTLRGELVRESLTLQNLPPYDVAERLAWLAGTVPRLAGSGIIYALTRRDAERVAIWLQTNGVDAHAYHADRSDEDRQDLERRLLNNQIKCLVATTALGMGYDKPDLTFVLHFQSPGNVVAYYQQVGRAGRAIPSAYGVLMAGEEDGRINAYFREAAFPAEAEVRGVLAALEQSENGLKIAQIERLINIRRSQIEKVLKLLAVEPQPPLIRVDGHWLRTTHDYRMDRQRIAHLLGQREAEWEEIQAYASNRGCLMQFLAHALDDPQAESCGKCANCVGRPALSAEIDRSLLVAARRFVRQSELPLELRKQVITEALPIYCAAWKLDRATLPPALKGEVGRTLSRWGEPVWGALVEQGKASGRFSDELVDASVELLRNRWPEARDLGWVTCVPSLRHPTLVSDFARRLAAGLGLPFVPAVEKSRDTDAQKAMENRFHQCGNLDGAFRIHDGDAVTGRVLLVDDVVDSGWTLTIATALLRQAGAEAVYPFALATSATN
jgi:ATP-dependent DNA helicase RecQ